MGFPGFLLKKKFYFHLVYAVIVTVILYFVVMKFLNIYTHHGETHIVPDFTGATLEEVMDQNFDEVFDFVFNDSVYDNKRRPGEIVLQNPSPGSKVKKGRNIYITTVAMKPEMKKMPDLKDLTLRQALAILKLNGLGINTLKYKPHIAENAVIGQYFNGNIIPADSLINKGSKIDLVLGQGANKHIPIPFLIGLTEDEAHDAINLASFNIGKEYFMDDGSEGQYRDDDAIGQFRDDDAIGQFRAYKQRPAWYDEKKKFRGDYINVWYRSDLNFNFDSLIEMLRPDALMMDSLDVVIPEKLRH